MWTKNEEMIQLTVKKILKLLINDQTSQDNGTRLSKS